MKTARMLGSYAEELANKNGFTAKSLGELLGRTEHQVRMFFKGRAYLSFPQMKILAETFNVSVTDLLEGNKDSYKANFVNCRHEFDNDENREKILDIIDDYIDLFDAVENSRAI